MLEESRKYTIEQQMVIERAGEGDLRFFFNEEEDVIQYGFIEYTDGSWHIKKIDCDWNVVDSEFDDLSWKSCEDALNARIFNGKSLLEILDAVTIP